VNPPKRSEEKGLARYNSPFTESTVMEAERINILSAQLSGFHQRTTELRRYL
jgi:hypothetical protein